jgi:3-dehydroquinate synthase
VRSGGIPGAVMYELHGSMIALGPALEGIGGDAIRERIGERRGVLISDSNVMPLYGHKLADRLGVDPADRFPFPAGEGNKNRIEWSRLTNAMLNRGVGRDSVVIAVGGGVAGDLAGFVAATYMRGIPFIQVPTSLLAMLDASIGGKTGVDTPAGKNLVGAFHHPELVLIDPTTLRTLPQREYRAGLAEALKHSLIDSADHFEWLNANTTALTALDAETLAQLLRRSLSVKHRVVLADERESGVRKTLNAGHTIGHAVESASEFGLLHGECVAIGLVVEARIAVALDIAKPALIERISVAAQSLNLPTAVPESIGVDAVIAATRSDKKARAGAVEYALLHDVGHVASAQSGYGTAVPDEVVRDAIEGSR